jgi:twitching motility protein PilT
MLIEDLLRLMVEKEASDLHLKVSSPPVLRIYGMLVPQTDLPEVTPQAVDEVFEEVTDEKQREIFAERLELDFAYEVPKIARCRVNASLQRGTKSLAFRRIGLTVPTIDELGLPEICKALALKPRGLILVTGPASSGKTTTLAAMIGYLNQRERRRVITIEDPIEYFHQDQACLITQRELGSDTRSFAEALKHTLRQDPDVILVGEMRDLETMAAVLTAAETGHLVMSTLHTSSASLTVDRIIDAFPPHQQQQIRVQLSTILEGVLTQILLPRLDGAGRVVAVEVMVATPAIRNLIREGKTHQMPNAIQTGVKYGMQTLEQALKDLYQKGLISKDEALAKANDPDSLQRLLGGR